MKKNQQSDYVRTMADLWIEDLKMKNDWLDKPHWLWFIHTNWPFKDKMRDFLINIDQELWLRFGLEIYCTNFHEETHNTEGMWVIQFAFRDQSVTKRLFNVGYELSEISSTETEEMISTLWTHLRNEFFVNLDRKMEEEPDSLLASEAPGILEKLQQHEEIYEKYKALLASCDKSTNKIIPRSSSDIPKLQNNEMV